MSSSRLVQVFLGAMIAALVAASFYTYAVIERRQDAVEKRFRYNVAYSASQAVIELTRLENALLQFENAPSEEHLDEVLLRFEILYNRTAVFGDGEFSLFVIASRDRQAIMRAMRDAIATADPVIREAGLDLDARRLIDIFAPLESGMIRLSSEANRYGADRAAQDQRELSVLHQRLSALAFSLILCGLCLVAAVTRHNRLLIRAHRALTVTTENLKRTASDLSAANAAVASANRELVHQNRLLVEKEDALRAQNVLFNAALNNMSQGLAMFDGDMRVMVLNARFERLFHVRPRDAAAPIAEPAARPSLKELIMPELASELEENIRLERAASFETECYDGRVIAVVQQPMSEGRWVATFEDVTDQRRAQARIIHMARHDGLTNLPNRYAFRERAQDALKESAAAGRMLALHCVDIDHFKEVNDTLGHPVGDRLLCAAAERLKVHVRDTDMVARFGGDEFAILQPYIERPDDAERLAARLIEEMQKPFLIDGEIVYATGSVGVALYPRHGDDPDVLQKNADLALYAAKADGRRTYRFFEPAMDERLTMRHILERDLRRAIAEDEFEIHYQPIVNLATRQITAAEALLRWTHAEQGAIPPSRFIPIAEESGLITQIGRWVLRQACADAATWPSHLKVSVNLSAAQFTKGEVVEDIREALSRAGLRPERLNAEITESLLLTESPATLDALHRMKALGINIAMDDFGTGYSSLSYLRKYPFDRIKIDRTFVNSDMGHEQNTVIIRTIVQLSEALGMTAIAEGVETNDDLAMLIAAGCHEGQGYLFSPPVPRERLSELLAADAKRMRAVA
jgi:diguanylate cyclase (GGDEF)-like protein